MKQESWLVGLWSFWIGLPAVALAVGAWRGWPFALLVLMAGVLAKVGYVRNFRHLSPWLGYGPVEDVRPPHHLATGTAVARVTLYTAAGCPFCPLVRERLEQLRQELWFDLDEKDVTLHPRRLTARGIRSVPVVETNGRRLVGNATSEALAAFLAAPAMKAAS